MPIYIAASGPAAARLAGRIGDGFICTSGKGEELYTQTLLPSLAEGAEKAGRDVSGMDRMIEMKVSFDTDYDRAKEDTKVWAALALPGDKKLGVHDPREMEVLAKEAEPYAHTRWLVSADPDEHVEQIAPYIGWGFNHLVFHFPGEAQLEAIDRYATRSCRGCAPASADGGSPPAVRQSPAGRTQTVGSIRAVTLPSSRATHTSMPTIMSPVRPGTGIDTSAGPPATRTPGVMLAPSPRFGWSNASNHRIRQPGSTANVSVSPARATRGAG